MAERVGQRYLLKSVLGRGGMGVVYEGLDEQSGTAVAVKVVRRCREDVDRFERELIALSRLESPYVCGILDSGDLPTGERYLVMPRLYGQTLHRRLERHRPLTLALSVFILDQVLAALEVAHAAGVVHRDLKPANVFLIEDPGHDFVKVLDFGIARLVGGADGAQTATGHAVGTAHYMAPEQARGQRDQDARVDVWAAGILLYEMVTGVLPYDGGSWAQTLERVLFDPYVPPRVQRPDLPEAVEAVIVRALQRARDDRYPDASAMRRDLVVAGRASLPPSPPPRQTMPDGTPAADTALDFKGGPPSDGGTPPTSGG